MSPLSLFFCLCFLISMYMIAVITIRSETATAAHTEPTVVATWSDLLCVDSRDAVVLGLGWATVELKQARSGTKLPEPSNSVQAVSNAHTCIHNRQYMYVNDVFTLNIQIYNSNNDNEHTYLKSNIRATV